MDHHYSHAVHLLLATLCTRLVAAAPEPPAVGLHEQLARLLIELSETDQLVPHPPSLGHAADAAAACLLNLATPDQLSRPFDDDLPRRLDELGRSLPQPELLALVKTAADHTTPHP
ncbi:hypothetical protein ACFPFX_10930 [Streptomyces mauvecolor]|uniref:Secreted protein n=1 Tax=Streptomyces mauvecolor TaxID=58345 RepID=A0ABV9UIE0_9ACTN